MKTSLLIATPAMASLLLVGCGSKPKPKTVAAAPVVEKEKAPTVRRTEAVKGDLREALLHLRRVHFAFDTDAILPEGRKALEDAATLLKLHPKVQIYIDGHTDERGTSEYNLALGEKRARACYSYLTRLGIPEQRLHIMTFGKEQPWDSGHGDVANAKNRRAEFRLIRGDARLVVDDGVLYDDKGGAMNTASK